MPDILASLFAKAQKLESDSAGSGGMKALDLWRSMAVNLDEISANTAGIDVNTRTAAGVSSAADGGAVRPGADGNGRRAARKKRRGKRRSQEDGNASPAQKSEESRPGRKRTRKNEEPAQRGRKEGTKATEKAVAKAADTLAGSIADTLERAGSIVQRTAKPGRAANTPAAEKAGINATRRTSGRLEERTAATAEKTGKGTGNAAKRRAEQAGKAAATEPQRRRDSSGRFVARDAAERAASDARAKRERQGITSAIAKGFSKVGSLFSSLSGRSGGQAGNVAGSLIFGPLQGAVGEVTGIARDAAETGKKALSFAHRSRAKDDKANTLEEKSGKAGRAESAETNRLLKEESGELVSQGNLAEREAVNAKKRHQELVRAVKAAGKPGLAGRLLGGLKGLGRGPKVRISAGRGSSGMLKAGRARTGEKKPGLFGRLFRRGSVGTAATAGTAIAAGEAAKGAGASLAGKGTAAVGKGGKGIIGRGVGALGRGAGMLGRGAGMLGRGALGALGPIGWAIGAGMSVMDGVEGWNNAGAYFGKSQEETTTGEKASAAAANILDFGGLFTSLASNLTGVNVTTADLARGLHDFGTTIADGTTAIGNGVLNFAKSILPDDTKQALQDATNWAIGAFTDAKNAASDFATGIADSLKDFAGKAWDGTKELAGKAWDSAKGAAAAIGTTAGKAWDGAKDTLSRGYHTLTDFFTGGKKEEKEKAPLAVSAEKGPAKAPTTETAPVASSSPSAEKPVIPAVAGMQAPKIQLTKPAALTMPVASVSPAPAPKPAAESSPAPAQAPTPVETVPAATATGTKPAGTNATGRSAEEILSGIAGTLSEMAEAQGPLAKDVHKLADDFATVFDPDAVRNTRMLQELMTANGTLSANQLSGANAAPYTPGGAGIVPQGSSGFLPTGTAKRSADARMGEEVKAKVVAAAQAKGINPDLALALIQQESGGDVNSTMHNTNGTTDWGLMQVNDAVIADYNRKHGTNLDPRHNINDNITVGMDELAGHLQKWGGDVDKALLAYNRGDGGANSWLRSGKSAQDNDYVRKVRSYMSAGTPAPIPAALGAPASVGAPVPSGPVTAMSGAVSALTDNAMARRVGYGYGSKNSASGAIDCSGWVSETNSKIFSTMGERGRYANAVMRGSMLQGKERDYAGTAAGIVLSVSRANGHLLQGEELAPQNIREGIAIGVAANPQPDQKGRFGGITHIVQTYRDPKTGQIMVSESRGGGVGVTKTPYAQWYQDNVIRKHRPIFGADMQALAGQGATAPVGGAQQQPVDAMEIVQRARSLGNPAAAAMATAQGTAGGIPGAQPVSMTAATGTASAFPSPVTPYAGQTAEGATTPQQTPVPQVSTITGPTGGVSTVSMTGTETLLRAIFDLLKGHFATLDRDTGKRRVTPPIGPGGAQIPTGYGDADLQAFAQDRA